MAAKRKGLGKGINNLIPETDVIRSTPKKKTEKKEVVKEVVKEVIKEVKVPVPGDTMMKISDIELIENSQERILTRKLYRN